MRYDDENKSYSRQRWYQPYNRSRQENWGSNFGDESRPYGEDYGDDSGDDYWDESRARSRGTQSNRHEDIGFSYESSRARPQRSAHGRSQVEGRSRGSGIDTDTPLSRGSARHERDLRRERGYMSDDDFDRGRENLRSYTDENYPGHRETYKRNEYPETYRSARSGYISEHVGHDRGRKDYFQTGREGNLYGSQFGLHKGKGPKNYKRSDERIREEIIDRLTDDPWVDAVEIQTDVKNGEVILSGTVNEKSGKRRAEDIVETVSGVTNVENRLRLGSATSRQRW